LLKYPGRFSIHFQIPQLAMSATYENFGISFMYPENWEISSASGAQDANQSVTVQSPTSGFWSLDVYRSDSEPQHLADQVRQTMASEYEGLEAQPVSEDVGSAHLVGYDMDFYYLDFVITAQVRSVRVGKRTFVLFCQAESRDFDKLAPVFQAMTVSLLRQA
jgi:hypothetical protein